MLEKGNNILEHQSSATRVYFVLWQTHLYNISMRRKGRILIFILHLENLTQRSSNVIHQFHLLF